jgi:hypothetical protein
MRFMVIRRADEMTEAGVFPDNATEIFEAMGNYMEDMAKAGVLLAGDGLKPSSEGARIQFRGGVPTVVDGPYAEAKELIAGYNLIDVSSKEEAIEWVKRWPAVVDNNPVIEIRQVFEDADFEGLS